jgi:hypothetical protein
VEARKEWRARDAKRNNLFSHGAALNSRYNNNSAAVVLLSNNNYDNNIFKHAKLQRACLVLNRNTNNILVSSVSLQPWKLLTDHNHVIVVVVNGTVPAHTAERCQSEASDATQSAEWTATVSSKFHACLSAAINGRKQSAAAAEQRCLTHFPTANAILADLPLQPTAAAARSPPAAGHPATIAVGRRQWLRSRRVHLDSIGTATRTGKHIDINVNFSIPHVPEKKHARARGNLIYAMSYMIERSAWAESSVNQFN